MLYVLCLSWSDLVLFCDCGIRDTESRESSSVGCLKDFSISGTTHSNELIFSHLVKNTVKSTCCMLLMSNFM